MSAGSDAYVVGIDFGPLSGRAVVVRVSVFDRAGNTRTKTVRLRIS